MEKKAGKTYKLRQRANLATLLRELRQRAGFSQREVASILNMNRSTYTYYETGSYDAKPDCQDFWRTAGQLFYGR